MASIPTTVKLPFAGTLSLFARLTRRHFQEEPLRSLLTVLGIALGMALVVSLKLANGAAIASFRNSVDLLAGKANLSLAAPVGSLPEKVLADLVATNREGLLLPLIEDKMALASDPKQFLTVLGVDLLKDARSREHHLKGADGKPLDRAGTLALLTASDGVFLSPKFAQSHGLKPGSKASFFVNDQVRTLHVLGWLDSSGTGASLDGTFALMDLAAAQQVFGKLGRLDRLEWVVEGEAARGRLEAFLKSRYPTYRVERPERRGEKIERMLAAFQANLMALSLVSLLVGAFLIYNSMGIAVLRRLEEIGALRVLGATRSQVFGWILGESLVLSLAGSILGMFLGRALAFEVLRIIGRTIRDQYVAMPLEERLPPLSFAGLWVLGGTLLILSAALPPALSAFRLSPSLSARKGVLESAFDRQIPWLTLAGLAAWGMAAALSFLPAWKGLPFFGYLAAFLLLTGAVLLTPVLLKTIFGALEKILRRLVPPEGVLAFRNLLAGLGRSSIAVGALVMAVALMVSVAVMVGSFRKTVVFWLNGTLKADLYIRPAVDQGGRMGSALAPSTLEALRSFPGVQAVETLRTVAFRWRETDIHLTVLDTKVMARYGTVALKEGGKPEEALATLAQGPSVLVSEPLALKKGVRAGDWIDLSALNGAVSLKVAGVYYDYGSEQGAILMDRGLYRSLFQDEAVNGAALYLQPDLAPEEAKKALLKQLPEGTQLFIRTNSALRTEALRIFDRTFAITYGMEAIALLVAVLGILTTLTALILERKPEIVLLRYVGALRGQVWRMIFWEAGWMGLLGAALGSAVGLALAVLLIRVINVQSFGWTIQWNPPWDYLAGALLAVFTATLLAGAVPARIAGRLPSMQEVTKE